MLARIPMTSIERQNMAVAATEGQLTVFRDDLLHSRFDIDDDDSPAAVHDFVEGHGLPIERPLLQRDAMGVFGVHVFRQDGFVAALAIENTNLSDVTRRMRRGEEDDSPTVGA